MKQFFLALAIVALCVSGAMAADMPTLAAYPPYFPIGNTFTTTPGNLYVKDILGDAMVVVGYAASPAGLGDNYMIQGNITMGSETDAGFVARANLGAGMTYECSIDSTNDYLNIVKINQGGSPQADNIGCAPSGYNIQPGETYRLVFRVDGTKLTADLFSPTGVFIKENTCTDSSYTTGSIGTWSYKKSAPIENTWANMKVSSLPLAGDANFSGTVNVADLTALLQNYNQSGFWPQGDFNSDGTVNVADLTSLLQNYNQSSTVVPIQGATPAPEPSTICLVLSGLAALVFYVLRNRQFQAHVMLRHDAYSKGGVIYR